jgi:hypothetical protein
MRCIHNVATNSVGFWVSDERADKSRNSFFMHVDHIVVNLDKDCFRVKVIEVGPELRPRSFEVVDFDVGRGSFDESVEPDCAISAGVQST